MAGKPQVDGVVGLRLRVVGDGHLVDVAVLGAHEDVARADADRLDLKAGSRDLRLVSDQRELVELLDDERLLVGVVGDLPQDAVAVHAPAHVNGFINALREDLLAFRHRIGELPCAFCFLIT